MSAAAQQKATGSILELGQKFLEQLQDTEGVIAKAAGTSGLDDDFDDLRTKQEASDDGEGKDDDGDADDDGSDDDGEGEDPKAAMGGKPEMIAKAADLGEDSEDLDALPFLRAIDARLDRLERLTTRVAKAQEMQFSIAKAQQMQFVTFAKAQGMIADAPRQPKSLRSTASVPTRSSDPAKLDPRRILSKAVSLDSVDAMQTALLESFAQQGNVEAMLATLDDEQREHVLNQGGK